MHISEEKILELKRRVNISYEEAERWLKRTNGNVELAEEKITRINEGAPHRFSDGFSNIFNYKMIIRNDEKVIIDLPFWIVLLVFFALSLSKTSIAFAIMVFLIVILITRNEIIITDRQEGEKLEKGEKGDQEHSKDIYTKEYSHNNANDESDNDNNGYYETEIKEHKDTVQQNNNIIILSDDQTKVEQKETNNKNDDYYEIVIDD